MATIEVNGTTLSYEEFGLEEGPTVVLSHSLFFDQRMFEPLISQIEDDFRVITYDHRGQGSSSRDVLERLSMDQLADDAAALIEQLKLGKVHFAGNSMGGFVALRLAARRPDLLLSAISMGSSAEEEHQLEAFGPLVAHMQAHGVSEVIDTIMHIMFSDWSLEQETDAVALWRQRVGDLDASIGDCAYQVIHRKRMVEELQGCRVPVLAIAGSDDHAYPTPVSSTNIAEATGGASIELDRAGHSVALERPEETAREIRDFISAL